MQQLPDALAPFGAYRQFILWTTSERNGKIVKLPVDYRTAEVCDAHNPEAWTDSTTAINTANAFGEKYGIGFVFTRDDPFFFIDIDKCLEGSVWSDVANHLMTTLQGAAVEISQSERGLHIFGQGITPGHSCKNIPLGLELYTEGRFVALTGTSTIGSAAAECSNVMPYIVDNYFPVKIAKGPEHWTTEPSSEWNGQKDDDKLIKKALASKSAASAFGRKASFADLWNKNEAVLSEMYAPDANDTGTYDESSVDAALAQHLAFWTGNDCERILALMWKSALVRDKWDRIDGYLKPTVSRAVSLQEVVYTGGKKPEPPRIPVEPKPVLNDIDDPEILMGYQFLGATQQIEHFKGCVYVQDEHKIFTPNGSLLKSEQFNATFGGYVFQLDSDGGGKVTRKAWEAFTESQAVRYPKAETTCFRPQLPPGTLVKEENQTLVNIYTPIQTPRLQGDATPFINHLAKVLPDERDRSILLAYMAACIQYKGVKFQWCPLIQGTPGNGKTLFTRCVEFAIGSRYTHLPRADQIDEKYNDWLFNKLFIGIEDIYVPGHKQEVIQILLPMITNDRLSKRAMQVGQVMGDVCANFMINANRKDGIRKTRDDRRFSMFFTAQQCKDDLTRDGMDGEYFPDLYDWLKGRNRYAAGGSGYGYAIVANFLETYIIPDELNPATTCHRAPKTSSTDEAIDASLGSIEQEIIEAIDEGRPGFAGGWVSSMAIERLFHDIRATRAIPHNKRRELMQGMGYDWHPALKDGRVNNPIMHPDAGKPRLFIKNGHIHSNLQTPAEVAKHYSEAQGGTPTPFNTGNRSTM